MEDFSTFFKVSGVDEHLGLVFGYGIVCLEKQADGTLEPYFDLQGHHIPEDEMLPAVTKFQLESAEADDMHDNVAQGTVVFSFPLSRDIAKSLGITAEKYGWLVGMKPSREIFGKFLSGEYTGFSIGGRHGLLVPATSEATSA